MVEAHRLEQDPRQKSSIDTTDSAPTTSRFVMVLFGSVVLNFFGITQKNSLFKIFN